MALIKVISGGQTGVDQAGLHAARELGIPTGGYAPAGFKTQDGPNLSLRDVFGLEATVESGYPPRTELNVVNSHGTIQIAKYFGSPGEALTSRLLLKHGRPRYPVHPAYTASVDGAVSWIHQNNIRILNIAGNSSKTWSEAFDWAYQYLLEVFKKVNEPT